MSKSEINNYPYPSASYQRREEACNQHLLQMRLALKGGGQEAYKAYCEAHREEISKLTEKVVLGDYSSDSEDF